MISRKEQFETQVWDILNKHNIGHHEDENMIPCADELATYFSQEERNCIQKLIKLIPLKLIYNMITDDRCWSIVDITESEAYDLANDFDKLIDILQLLGIKTNQKKIEWEPLC